MATCKECLHYDACGGYLPSDLDADVFDYCKKGIADEIPDIDERCSSFKDKSRFIELPCKVGTKVWLLRKDTVPDDDYRMSFHDEWVLCEVNFQLSMINQIGETVFLTREEAEQALKERSKNNA